MNRVDVSLDRTDGTQVVLTINGTAFVMGYDFANRLAVLLRGHGKMAKRNAGDFSTKVFGFGNLTDAVADELKAQRTRDGTAGFTLRA